VYGFAENDADVELYRGELLEELHMFKTEYEALMYGGTITTVVSQRPLGLTAVRLIS
jgi:hypothetical protein